MGHGLVSAPNHIAIVSDAWLPQINGVVRTLSTVSDELRALGHTVSMITPDQFWSMPCPTYPEIRLALFAWPAVHKRLAALAPDAIHIATEGPLGWAARHFCLKHGLPFTTSFHTRFPEYVNARLGTPVSWGYRVIRWFHRPASATMVATETLRTELADLGLGTLSLWSRGVDIGLFLPRPKSVTGEIRPIFLYVGRVAVEKNIEAFLKLDLPGTKLVVGDGPQRQSLAKTYPDVRFVGSKSGQALARAYAEADVFVFPSRTDTFGNVLLEALASGVPVAAYPVPGPQDVIGDNPVGCLDDDLAGAARRALAIPSAACRSFAERFTWRASAEQFLGNLAPISR